MGNIFSWHGHEDDGSTESHTQQSAKSTVSENNESQTILIYQDQLINVISPDVVRIAGILMEYDFISDEIFGKLFHPSSTPQEKATVLVNAVREKIKTVPKRFPELIRVFSEQAPTKDIAEMLQTAYNEKSKFILTLIYNNYIILDHDISIIFQYKFIIVNTYN